MWGTIMAIIPVVAMQAIRRFGIQMPEDNFSTAITTLPLALIPLSFGHSVVRYRFDGCRYRCPTGIGLRDDD